MLRLPPDLALLGFTKNAAAALGRKDIGTLGPGKRADLVIHNVPNYRFLAYRVGGSYVERVIKGGKIIYEAAG
jgi:imidazolonepropionase